MGTFDINGKVALVTGGASGLGHQYVLELLRKGAKGVTLADVNSETADKVLQEIENEFGKNKTIFVETDVTNYDQFENAFKVTAETFKYIDILINNAGVFSDAAWKQEIEINVHGTIHGILLGLDNYISKHKSGEEGVILNISSICGLSPMGNIPIYCGTKFAVHGMTLSWGHSSHYNRTNVTVVGVCPGVTTTPLIIENGNRRLGPIYDNIPKQVLPVQSPEQVAPHVMKIIEKAPPGTMWVVEAGKEPYQFLLPDRFNMDKHCL